MFFDEEIHFGRPHFHAAHGGYRASFDAMDLSRISGKMPARTERLVRQWAEGHQAELLANWERGRAGRAFKAIDPLK